MLFRILMRMKWDPKPGETVGKELFPGDIDDLKCCTAKTRAILLKKKRVVEVVPPPLAIIPGWASRAAEYAENGIKDVNDMSDAAEGLVSPADYAEARAMIEPSKLKPVEYRKVDPDVLGGDAWVEEDKPDEQVE